MQKQTSVPAIRGRNGQVNELGAGNLYFHNLGGARDVFDARTGTRHIATDEDACNAIRLLDALPNCHTVTPFFTPPDVSNELMALHMYRHALSNTTKPLQGPGIQFGHEVKYAVEMAAVVGTPAHELTLSLSPVSPLTMHDIAAEAIMEMAKAGVIHANLPCPTGGATSPMTITGSIVQQSAESLAPLVLAQIINPGCGVVYCGRLGMLEPRTGLIWGGVELGLILRRHGSTRTLLRILGQRIRILHERPHPRRAERLRTRTQRHASRLWRARMNSQASAKWRQA